MFASIRFVDQANHEKLFAVILLEFLHHADRITQKLQLTIDAGSLKSNID